MNVVITKNNFHELNCFFTRNGLNNISRPDISYLKIDSASNIQPIFHIGFKENMGFIDSFKINGGVFVFEVLSGYPLQDLLFSHNQTVNSKKNYKFRLEDLDPMDFYCVQSKNEDIFGDFVLKNLKFISTKMDQSADNYGRRIIAEFICSEMLPFQIPYFYNNFISDNYDYHIIRDKNEIINIQKDIVSISSLITNNMLEKYINILYPTNKPEINLDYGVSYILNTALDDVFNNLVIEYISRKKTSSDSSVIKLQLFIKEFYNFKNKIGEEQARKDSRLMLTNYTKLRGV
jgi:hypothetical protein